MAASSTDGCVDDQDYNDGAQNDHPIGKLNARYRCLFAKPFHDYPPIFKQRLTKGEAPTEGSGPSIVALKVLLTGDGHTRQCVGLTLTHLLVSDDADEEVTVDAAEYLLNLLCCMQRWKNYLNRDQAAFAQLLRDIPGLQEQWATFTGQGGQSAADFAHFLDGEFRPRLLPRRKGPLQLVAKKSQPIRSGQQRRKKDEGPDAA